MPRSLVVPHSNLAESVATETASGNGTLVLVLLAAFVLLLLAGKAASQLAAILRPFMQPLALLGTVVIWAFIIVVFLLNALLGGSSGPSPPVRPDVSPPDTSVVIEPGAPVTPAPPVTPVTPVH
jgi:hypothetical protein